MVEYLIKEESLVALADALRERTGNTDGLSFPNGFIGALDELGSNLPDNEGVTFGNVDDVPVEREESYAISSEDLNALGAITQKMAGKSTLMTVDDMIYWLNRVQYIPQGYAESYNSCDNSSFASGIVPTVYIGSALSSQSIYNTSSATGALVESA